MEFFISNKFLVYTTNKKGIFTKRENYNENKERNKKMKMVSKVTRKKKEFEFLFEYYCLQTNEK